MNTTLLTNDDIPPLYDKASLLNVTSSMAHGYIVLLGGIQEQSASKGKKKKKVNDSSIDLAFAALVDGNVVDACFGITSSSKRSSSAAGVSKEIKEVLRHVVDKNESVKKIAVEAYRNAFRVVVSFEEKVKKLNFFTFCLKYGKLQRDAECALKEAFENLEDAIKNNL